MYNRLNKHLSDQKILYEKQFGFQKNHSTVHAIIELVSKITDSFEKNMFTLGVFIDLSKAFDTVNHEILISKLENYGLDGSNLEWFKNYLTNRKQCIVYDGITTTLKHITCGVPQGSILGPLLFLIYVNDLHKSSSLIDFLLYADDTNLFFSHSNIKILFETVNNELDKINQWFVSNKLSLNTKKTKYVLFCKNSKVDNLPLKLPPLKISNVNIVREYNMDFLGVILNETLNWKQHIETIENKISKNIGILYKSKPFLDIKSLKQLYFSFINSYIDYCNIAWGSTNQTILKKILSKQKHALRIIFGQDKYTTVQHRFQEIGAQNIFDINLLKISLFMFKTHNGLSPSLFKDQFKPIDHKFSTRFSSFAYTIPKANLKCNCFSIKYRGPFIWNYLLTNKLRKQPSLNSFKSSLKKFLFNSNIDQNLYF